MVVSHAANSSTFAVTTPAASYGHLEDLVAVLHWS